MHVDYKRHSVLCSTFHLHRNVWKALFWRGFVTDPFNMKFDYLLDNVLHSARIKNLVYTLELSTSLKTKVIYLCLKGAKNIKGNTGTILSYNWMLFYIQLPNWYTVSTDLHPGYFARTFNFIIRVWIQSRTEDRKTEQSL